MPIKPRLSILLLAMFAALSAPSSPAAGAGIEPQREFRAAWISTVANIDWPSSRNLSTHEQQAELTAILDKALELNLNAVILQVRPMADAVYPSNREPWSEFLTGQTGRAPEPYWDPLQFAVEESHRRGLALHAWFNPYRARHPSAESQLPANHVARARPGIVREYGRYLWMDPTDEETKQHTLDVILDVVRRYDIDGVHLDDYFYPYPYYADGRDFPDDANWRAFRESGGSMSRGDWRRSHVNDFIERLYTAVKREDPHVLVGISPFGIWRPGHPEGIEGMDQYATLYADARKWLREGWLDYLSPQLYWQLDQRAQAYAPLLDWWIGENQRRRHIWPGNFTSRIEMNGGWPPREITDQIQATRQRTDATGNIHFSMVALMQNRQGIADRLKQGAYSEPALLPRSPWLQRTAPSRPEVEAQRDPDRQEIFLTWHSPEHDDIRQWALYTRDRNAAWKLNLVPAQGTRSQRVVLPDNGQIELIGISAVDALGNESERSLLRVR